MLPRQRVKTVTHIMKLLRFAGSHLEAWYTRISEA
jgi:hypothetical protein